ncbi:MAG TPA: hypothetical protein VFV99_03955 [Kofleriaceae bacterium]|nr:hypothetical protein [Kofleriaceae bacterium]
MRLYLVAFFAVVACGDDGAAVHDAAPDTPDLCAKPASSCNPLSQSGCGAGEKCTWILDALMPQYAGHIGCARAGNGDIGAACTYRAPGCDGYDNCKQGLVCSDFFGGAGVCKQVCDYQGGIPACDAQHSCVPYSGLFETETTMQAAGVCDVACNPLTDNDFDGAGTASTRTTNACGSDPTIGCYGYPSFGTFPKTEWSCTIDRNAAIAQPTGLRHRVLCTTANGCADPSVYINSCNQGYLPLLRESTMVSTAICTALCKPKNCFAGSCGTGDIDRLGAAPHRCQTPDRVGSFNTGADGEHCRFIWSFEIDTQGNFLRSSTSDTVGFCFDHSKYLYDSNADNTPDTPLPACATLPDGFATTTSKVDGAADIGCVDTTHAQLAHGKAPAQPTFDDLRPLFTRAVK